MKIIARAASTWYWSWCAYILLILPFIYVVAFVAGFWNAAIAGGMEFSRSIVGGYEEFTGYVGHVISREGWQSRRESLREDQP